MRLMGSIALLAFLLLAVPAMGKEGEAPADVLRAFHKALAAGDREGALALLDPAVVIFEQGGAEMSRDEYASHHLGDDIEFSRATARKVTEERSGRDRDHAWVLTISETSGSFQGKDVSSRNAETIVLKRTESGWRIVHIHWSSRRQNPPKP